MKEVQITLIAQREKLRNITLLSVTVYTNKSAIGAQKCYSDDFVMMLYILILHPVLKSQFRCLNSLRLQIDCDII